MPGVTNSDVAYSAVLRQLQLRLASVFGCGVFIALSESSIIDYTEFSPVIMPAGKDAL